MRGLWRAILIAGCAAAAIAPLTSANAAPVPAAARDAYAAYVALEKAHKCPEMLDMHAQPAVAAMLATLPLEQRLWLAASGYSCAAQSRQFELALKFATDGTALNDPRPAFWLARLAMDWATGKHAAMVATVEAMATANPEALKMVDFSLIGQASYAFKAAGELDLEKRVNKVFGAPGYQPAQPGQSVDGYRYSYAGDEMAAGHSDAAATIFARITSPSLLIRATLDPRVRALVAPGFDARAAVERHLDATREVAAAHPDDLQATIAVVNDYMLLDKGAEILALLIPMQPGKAHPTVTATLTTRQSWWTHVAQAYVFLGDYDKSVATMQQSMAPGEVNEKNAVELAEIAARHLQFGHPAQTLAILAAYTTMPKDMNANGIAYVHRIRGCAAWQAGTPALAEADLAALRLQDGMSPGNLLGLELCMHHDDEAAAVFIKYLATPDKLPETLVMFSTFLPMPKTYPHDWYRDAIERLKLRPDIRAAIAKAGGAGNFDIPPL